MSVKLDRSQARPTAPGSQSSAPVNPSNEVDPTPVGGHAIPPQTERDAFLARAKAEAAPEQPKTLAKPGRIYVVQGGDTLGKIAAKFSTKTDVLAKENGISNPNLIAIGQQLKISSGAVVLTVEKGDTLKSIAAKYGIAEATLAAGNGLKAGAAVKPGQSLLLPGGHFYTVKAGDNLSAIAKKYGTTAQAIGKANGMANLNVIRIGQELVVVGKAGPVPPPPKPDPLADPALMKEHRGQGYKYELDKRDQLYVSGLGADDVLQGQAGDCYFLAAIAGVAKSQPKVIQDAITKNADGSYSVRFYEETWTSDKQTFKPVVVKVDGDLAGDVDYRLYADEGRTGTELWAPLMEKAYAKWKGGYEEIGNGGFSDNVLKELTGKQSSVASTDYDKAWLQTMKAKLAAGGVVCAATRTDKEVKAVPGIVGNHAYTVLGVEEKNGQTLIRLRNPWGHTEFGKDGNDDGTFTMPAAKFKQGFSEIQFLA